MSKTKGKPSKKEDEKKKTKSSFYTQILSEDRKDWIRKNWKTTLIVLLSTVLVFVMKIHEESSSYLDTQKPEENLYEVLGLSASSSIKDIKRQYNKLAMELHPDKHPDCKTCQEKFGKISYAYEILIDEEKRLHYDETEGILVSLKSASRPIYEHNYQKTVLESPYLWILQVYSENSSRCQTFSGFWEEFIEEFDYLKFGRIHFVAQKNLLPKLPFAIDDLPFVFAISQKQNSEVLEYPYDASPNASFRAFVRKSIGIHYYTMDFNQFSQMVKKRPAQKTVFNIFTDTIPIPFAYYAFMYGSNINFYTSTQGSNKGIISQLQSTKPSLVVFNEEEMINIPAIREFEIGYSKNAFKSLLSYLMFTSIPRYVNRNIPLFIQRLLQGG